MSSRVVLALMMMVISLMSHAVSIDSLAWLSGCWAHESAEPGSMEAWLAPAGGSLFGVSRTVKDGRTVAHEFMQIHTVASGSLAFTAKPSDQKEATFPLLRADANEVVFENLAHDFPQRITYRLQSTDSLLARIEGARNGKTRSIDYPMKRTRCEAKL